MSLFLQKELSISHTQLVPEHRARKLVYKLLFCEKKKNKNAIHIIWGKNSSKLFLVRETINAVDFFG